MDQGRKNRDMGCAGRLPQATLSINPAQLIAFVNIDFDLEDLFANDILLPNKMSITKESLVRTNKSMKIGDPCYRCERPLRPAPLTLDPFCGKCEMDLEEKKP